MDKLGRKLRIGPTDNTSNERTPRENLRIIPAGARESFMPYSRVQPGIRMGENDLTRLAPGLLRAKGDAIEMSGQILDDTGQPLRHALVEIWNANKYGKYAHDLDGYDAPLDPNFIGLGRMLTDEEGRYKFWTIDPGCYLARPDINRWRPKHIHLSIRGGASRLITQMYFKDAEHNDTDPMRIVMGDDFHLNIGKQYETPDIDVERGYKFNIVIRGKNSTFFE